jgi:hypothetical protein
MTIRLSNILLLDCTLNNDPSEGTFLKEMLESCQFKYNVYVGYERIKTKTAFIKALKNENCDAVHISAHGGILTKTERNRRVNLGKSREHMYIDLPFGTVYPHEIKGKIGKRAKLVFLNACAMDWKVVADSFFGPNVRYFLAPYYNVDFDDAMIFAARFYQRIYSKKNTPDDAFSRAREELKLGSMYKSIWKKDS